MQAFGRCSFLRNEVCLIKFSFKWRSKYFIWKLICSANFWHLDFFLVKDLTNCLIFLLIVSIWEHNHLATMWQLKNRCPLSAPLRAYFSYPQLPKKPFVKADIKQLSPIFCIFEKVSIKWWVLSQFQILSNLKDGFYI